MAEDKVVSVPLTRRQFITRTAGLAAIGILSPAALAACATGSQSSTASGSSGASTGASLVPSGGVSTGKQVVVHGFGGSWTDNARKAWYEPFTAKTGIQVVENTDEYSAAKLKAMVDTKTVAWDLHTPDDIADAKFTAQQGLLEKIDTSIVDTTSLVKAKDIVGDQWVTFDVESVVLTYSTGKYGSNPPGSWADYFDVAKFPGKRAFQDWVQTAPEKALLADGVDPAKLYPLDLDRAFKVLDAFKPNILLFWPIAQQVLSQQLLLSGQVDMLDMWNGRATQIIAQGAKGAIQWNQGFYAPAPFAIPKGAKNLDNAQAFLNFVLQPEQQAAWSNLSGYGYVNPKAAPLVKPEMQSQLPTAPDNFSKMVELDADWWAANLAKVQPRYQAWVSGA